MVSFRKSAVIQISLLWLAQQGWVAAQQQLPEGVQPRPGQTAPASTEPAKPAEPAKPDKDAPADPSDEGLSFGLFYWYAPMHPHMRNGEGASATASPSTLDYPNKNQPAPGAMLSIPAGKYNSLRISYFRSKGPWSTTTAATPVQFFGSSFNKGDALSVGYTLQIGKVSWDYMSWPFPIQNSTFRIKTLFEAQYIHFQTSVNGPTTVDSAGNVSQTTASGRDWFIYPTFGVGLEKLFTKSFRWEGRASGIYVYHHAAIGDLDSFFAYKRGKLEIDAGAKMFYFKTSPSKQEYVWANMPGAYVGLRWYFE